MRHEFIIDRAATDGDADQVVFRFVSVDQFGKWRVDYWRRDSQGDHPSYRPIIDDYYRRIDYRDRKPMGHEVLAACVSIVGRTLTPSEEYEILNLPVRVI